VPAELFGGPRWGPTLGAIDENHLWKDSFRPSPTLAPGEGGKFGGPGYFDTAPHDLAGRKWDVRFQPLCIPSWTRENEEAQSHTLPSIRKLINRTYGTWNMWCRHFNALSWTIQFLPHHHGLKCSNLSCLRCGVNWAGSGTAAWVSPTGGREAAKHTTEIDGTDGLKVIL